MQGGPENSSEDEPLGQCTSCTNCECVSSYLSWKEKRGPKSAKEEFRGDKAPECPKAGTQDYPDCNCMGGVAPVPQRNAITDPIHSREGVTTFVALLQSLAVCLLPPQRQRCTVNYGHDGCSPASGLPCSPGVRRPPSARLLCTTICEPRQPAPAPSGGRQRHLESPPPRLRSCTRLRAPFLRTRVSCPAKPQKSQG